MSMNLRTIKGLYQTLIHPTTNFHHQHQQCRGIAKVRLKWVKNRGLDHVIDVETDVKAVWLLKNAIKRSSTGFLTSKTVADWQRLLGLTVPVLRFLRRYPTLFAEFPHAKYASLRCFKLTDTALLLDSREQDIHQTHEFETVERVCRLLMMMKSRVIPFQSLQPLKWDLGLPDDFERVLIRKYPDHFQVVKAANGLVSLGLSKWRDEFAVSELQRRNENGEKGNEYRDFKTGKTALVYPMSFPRGYGLQTKVKAWMEEFQKLPYISPYEDFVRIDPNSELMEKRVVGVFHEFLSLTMHKKTKRNYLRSLREELNLPLRFTRLFTRYPGIFYLSLKCNTTTVALREGYHRGKLLNPHPLVRIRNKYYRVMRTGILYRGKGMNLTPEDILVTDGQNGTEGKKEEEEEEEEESGDEFYEENDESGEDSGSAGED